MNRDLLDEGKMWDQAYHWCWLNIVWFVPSLFCIASSSVNHPYRGFICGFISFDFGWTISSIKKWRTTLALIKLLELKGNKKAREKNNDTNHTSNNNRALRKFFYEIKFKLERLLNRSFQHRIVFYLRRFSKTRIKGFSDTF